MLAAVSENQRQALRVLIGQSPYPNAEGDAPALGARGAKAVEHGVIRLTEAAVRALREHLACQVAQIGRLGDQEEEALPKTSEGTTCSLVAPLARNRLQGCS